jgi:hypothetical protein
MKLFLSTLYARVFSQDIHIEFFMEDGVWIQASRYMFSRTQRIKLIVIANRRKKRLRKKTARYDGALLLVDLAHASRFSRVQVKLCPMLASFGKINNLVCKDKISSLILRAFRDIVHINLFCKEKIIYCCECLRKPPFLCYPGLLEQTSLPLLPWLTVLRYAGTSSYIRLSLTPAMASSTPAMESSLAAPHPEC